MATNQEILAELSKRGLSTPTPQAPQVSQVAPAAAVISEPSDDEILAEIQTRNIKIDPASTPFQQSVKQQQVEALQSDGALGSAGAFLADVGATFSKVAPNFTRLLSGDESAIEEAEKEISQIEAFQELLREANPSAVFGEVAAIGSTIPATMVASAGLAAVSPKVKALAAAPTLIQRGLNALQVAGRTAPQAALASGEAVAFAEGEDDIQRAAIEGGLFGAAGEAVVPIAKQLKTSLVDSPLGEALGTAKDEVVSALESIDVANRIKERVGISLTPAQQTLSPTKIAEQRVLLTTDEGSKIGIDRLKGQNQEAGLAVEEFLNTIADPTVIRTADERFRDVAEKVMIEGQKELNALFKQPYARAQKAADADPDKLFRVADSMTRRLDAQIKAATNPTALSALTTFRKAIDDNSTSIQGMLDAKDQVDVVLESLGTDSKSLSAVKKARNQIKSAEKQLNAQLAKEFPFLKEVNKRFAEKRGEILGSLERIGFGKFSNIDDQQLKLLSKRVFDASETNPKVIEETKRILKRSGVEGAEQAFDDLLRVELDRRILTTKADLDSVIAGDAAALSNLPSILKTGIFGRNQAQRDVLLRALNPRQKSRALALEDALDRASKGRIEGSQTESNQAALRRIENSGMARGFFNFLKGGPIKGVLGIGDEAAKAAKRAAVSEVAFDPTWGPQFDKIQRIKSVKAKADAFEKLLIRVEAGVLARTALRTPVEPILNSESEGNTQ